MNSRLKWTNQEQEILKLHGATNAKNKWTIVAQLINEQQPSIKKTPKQCRQKYNNHLIFGKKPQENNWTQRQDVMLFDHYKDKGPKWKAISQSFETKSQNTIKNRFYGNVRKVVRKLNKIGKERISKSFKPLKQKSIVRIIEPDTGLLQASEQIAKIMSNLRLRLLDKIQKGSSQAESQESYDNQDTIQLIRDIHKFNSKCRFFRRSKGKPCKNFSKSKRQRSNTNATNEVSLEKNEECPNSQGFYSQMNEFQSDGQGELAESEEYMSLSQQQQQIKIEDKKVIECVIQQIKQSPIGKSLQKSIVQSKMEEVPPKGIQKNEKKQENCQKKVKSENNQKNQSLFWSNYLIQKTERPQKGAGIERETESKHKKDEIYLGKCEKHFFSQFYGLFKNYCQANDQTCFRLLED